MLESALGMTVRKGSAVARILRMSGLYVLGAMALLTAAQVLAAGSARNEVDRPSACDSLLQQAKQAEIAGKFADAAKYHLDCLKLEPQVADVYQRLGLDYYLDGRFAEAIPVFTKALSLRSDLWGSDLFLGISYYRLGQYQKALGPLKEAIRLKPDLNDAHFWLGASLLAVGRADAAISELQRVAKRSDLGLQADSLLVQAYRKAAEGYYRQIEASSPDSARAYQIRAEHAVWEGKTTEATVEYREALKRNPDIEGIHRAIADLDWQHGLFDEAAKEYAEELRLNPLDGESRLQLGLYWFNRGDMERGRQNLEVASRATQNSSIAYQALGQAWLKLGDLPKAESSLNKAVRADSADPLSHQFLAEVYERMGRADLAQKERELFQKLSAKSGNPSNADQSKEQ